MVAIGCYFAFIIVVMGTLLAANDITDEIKQQFFQDILTVHNKYRRLHGSPDLVLNDNLNQVADKHVKEWTARKTSTLSDAYGVNYSQTIFDPESDLNSRAIVSSWYKNKKNYEYTDNPSPRIDTEPFTQLVWNGTTEIGVGVLVDKKVISAVVIYSPAGNIPGQYKSNVSQPISNLDPEDEQFINSLLTFKPE